MAVRQPAVGPLARTLRAARKAQQLSIVQLAALAEVSPRLVSELERGMRAHVSFETATRLLHLVGVAVTFEPQPLTTADDAARIRADARKKAWSGGKSTLSTQAPPPPPSDAAARLMAVARVSRIAAGLQRAYRETRATPAAPSRK